MKKKLIQVFNNIVWTLTSLSSFNLVLNHNLKRHWFIEGKQPVKVRQRKTIWWCHQPGQQSSSGAWQGTAADTATEDDSLKQNKLIFTVPCRWQQHSAHNVYGHILLRVTMQNSKLAIWSFLPGLQGHKTSRLSETLKMTTLLWSQINVTNLYKQPQKLFSVMVSVWLADFCIPLIKLWVGVWARGARAQVLKSIKHSKCRESSRKRKCFY